LAWFPGLFWRNEYRYASYGSADVPISTNGVFIFPGFGEHTEKRVQTIATELVYKFHWSAGP
jgi:outer membrane immunogenic protein